MLFKLIHFVILLTRAWEETKLTNYWLI